MSGKWGLVIAVVVSVVSVSATSEASTSKSSKEKPRRPKGEACETRHHCQKGLICWKNKCASKRKEGSSCRWSPDCRDEMVCLGVPQPETSLRFLECTDGEKTFIADYRMKGASCIPFAVGGAPTTGKRGKCGPRREVGQKCDRGQCTEGAQCLHGKCSKGARGQSCKSDDNCEGDLICVNKECK